MRMRDSCALRWQWAWWQWRLSRVQLSWQNEKEIIFCCKSLSYLFVSSLVYALAVGYIQYIVFCHFGSFGFSALFCSSLLCYCNKRWYLQRFAGVRKLSNCLHVLPHVVSKRQRHFGAFWYISTDSTTSICFGYVAQHDAQQIYNKSK